MGFIQMSADTYGKRARLDLVPACKKQRVRTTEYRPCHSLAKAPGQDLESEDCRMRDPSAGRGNRDWVGAGRSAARYGDVHIGRTRTGRGDGRWAEADGHAGRLAGG